MTRSRKSGIPTWYMYITTRVTLMVIYFLWCMSSHDHKNFVWRRNMTPSSQSWTFTTFRIPLRLWLRNTWRHQTKLPRYTTRPIPRLIILCLRYEYWVLLLLRLLTYVWIPGSSSQVFISGFAFYWWAENTMEYLKIATSLVELEHLILLFSCKELFSRYMAGACYHTIAKKRPPNWVMIIICYSQI